MSGIQERLEQIKEEIEHAASKRPVTLIAVSKTKPLPMLLEAYQAGQIHFGENKVQEAREKRPSMPADSVFHLIGSLQKNKAKYCPTLFSWVHSLDRLDTALKLQESYSLAGQDLNVLVQVNLTGESSKSGFLDLDAVEPFCESILSLSRLQLRGLMTIGEPGLDESVNRNLFSQLRKLQEKIARSLGVEDRMNQLSMGMSQDWKWALQEGATLLRIGSAIFGRRNYSH